MTTTHITTDHYNSHPVGWYDAHDVPVRCDYCHAHPTISHTLYNYSVDAWVCEDHRWDIAPRVRFEIVTMPNAVQYLIDAHGTRVLVRYDSDSDWYGIVGATDTATLGMLDAVFSVAGYFTQIPAYAIGA